MIERKLNVAVVGLGFGAEFVPIYLDHPDVGTVSICDSRPERIDHVAERFPVERRYQDFAEVLADAEVDAVHILSGIPDHAPQSEAVLLAGKHCACTVPMATTLDEMRAIVKASSNSRRNYMMMETMAYTRQFFYAKSLLDEGAFGRIQFLRGSYYQDMEGWPPYWAGLPPMWYATHVVGPLLALAETRATSVHCFGSGEMRDELHAQYGNPYPVETAIFTLDRPSLCAEVTRSLFHCARPYMEAFTVYGENACYEWQMEWEDPLLFQMSPVVPGQGRELTTERPEPPDRADLLPPLVGRHTQRFLYGKDRNGAEIWTGGGHHGSHPHMVHEFVRSIVEGRRPAIDAVTSANWTAPGVCAHQSAMRGGQKVEIPAFD